MESSRRSFDRSREPGLIKKPRLNDDVNGRPFPQRPLPSATNARLRAIQRESEGFDAGRGGSDGGTGGEAYHPQPPQHQELIVQYRNALAELTFNSKPIITNLTIIAGENQYAAKDIAAMVCANILEVPSDQKLPSLYLLDSIVKNIGSDYIKFFAARLPEVFCKAFKLVDPSVHASLRHLFGTWKGVFPPQTLQMIEKELGFNQSVNSSASGVTAMRTNPQTQRPPHSIHVNPKYLERQRLQQASKVKGAANNMAELSGRASEDTERLGRTVRMNAGRTFIDSNVKNHDNQPSLENEFTESIHEKSSTFNYGGNEYVSGTLASGIGRSIVRSTEIGRDKAWYKTGSGVLDTSNQRNGLNIKREIPNFEARKSSNVTSRFHATQNFSKLDTSGLSNSWKNSEEEEFMWDNMNSGLRDHGASAISNSFTKDHWTPDDEDDDENLEIVNLQKGNAKPDVGSATDRGTSTDQQQLMTHAGYAESPWASQDTHLGCSGTYSSTLSARIGSKPLINSSHSGGSGVGLLTNSYTASSGVMGPRQSGGSALPSEHEHPQSPPLAGHAFQPQLRNSNEKGRLSFSKTSQLSAAGLENKNTQDSSLTLPSKVSVGSLQKANLKDLKIPMPLKASSQKRQRNSSSQLQQVESKQRELSDTKEKTSLSQVSDHETQSTAEKSASEISSSLHNETSEPSTASSLLAAVMKSRILARTSITGNPSMSLLDAGNLSSQSGRRSQPLSRSPSQDTSVPMVSLSSPLPSSNNNKTVLPNKCQKKEEHLSVAAAPPPPSAVSSSSVQTSNVLNNSANPISNILSSLVAKGLISARAESKNVVQSDMLSRLQDHSEGVCSSTSQPVSLVSTPAVIPSSISKDKLSCQEHDLKSSALCSPSSPTEIKSLIGFEFKPDVLREFHSPVLRELYDDCLNCSICGLRLKFQDQMDRHLEWHNLSAPTENDEVKKSRSWYANSCNWVSGTSQFPSESEDHFLDQVGQLVDEVDPMVLADESQCVCPLCGELFEDFYSQEREEWMFKGAIYMAMNSGLHEDSTGPIVHAKCVSESSTNDLGIFNRIKMDEDV